MTAFSMERGTTKVLRFTISPLGATGLAGFSFCFTAKDADASAVIHKTTADFHIVAEGDAQTPGVVTVTINPTDTASLPDYDVNLVWDFNASGGTDSGTLTVTRAS